MAMGTHVFEDELRRISSGPRVDESAPGMGAARFIAYCPGCASLVNERVPGLMRVISALAAEGWGDGVKCGQQLPEWFKSASPKPRTSSEDAELNDRWRRMRHDEQVAFEACPKGVTDVVRTFCHLCGRSVQKMIVTGQAVPIPHSTSIPVEQERTNRVHHSRYLQAVLVGYD